MAAKSQTLKLQTATIPGALSAALAVERLRISSIMESPEGLRNPDAARQLALHSTMEVASAISFLKTVPASNPYLTAMEAHGPIDIGGPSLGAPISTDARAARLEELKGATDHYNETKGYTKPRKSRKD